MNDTYTPHGILAPFFGAVRRALYARTVHGIEGDPPADVVSEVHEHEVGFYGLMRTESVFPENSIFDVAFFLCHQNSVDGLVEENRISVAVNYPGYLREPKLPDMFRDNVKNISGAEHKNSGIMSIALRKNLDEFDFTKPEFEEMLIKCLDIFQNTVYDAEDKSVAISKALHEMTSEIREYFKY